jgi:hypothetical protein
MTTFSKLYRTISLLTATMLLLSTSACMLPRPLTDVQIDEQKGKLGAIGIVAGSKIPNVYIKVPARNVTEGMKEGAKVPIQAAGGLVQGCDGSAAEFCLLVLATGVALAPAGAIVGGLKSAVSPDQTEVINVSEAKINQTLADLHMNEHLRDRFASQLADLQTFTTKKVATTATEQDGQKPDYRSLRPTGVDTVSEVEVQTLSLSGLGVVQPNLSLYLYAQVRLISTVDNKNIISRHYSCWSKTSTFEEWASQDAQKFRAEIEHCYDTIAKNAVTDLFVNNTLLLSPGQRPQEPSTL